MKKISLAGRLTWNNLRDVFQHNGVSVRTSALLVSDEIWSSLAFDCHPYFDPATNKADVVAGDLGVFHGMPVKTEAAHKEKFVIKPDEFWVVPEKNVKDLKGCFTRKDFEKLLLQIDETKVIAGTVFNEPA